MKSLRGLTHHQLVFINSYAEHRDGPRALRESGFLDGRDMTQDNQLITVAKWLADETIGGEVDRRLFVAAAASAVTQAEIIDELRKIAFLDFRDLFQPNGDLKSIHDMDEDVSRALAVCDVLQAGENGLVTKVTTSSKLKALELLGKHRRMFIDRVEVEHKGKAGITFGWQLPEGESAEGLDGVDAEPVEAAVVD
jgi:phage terminase small subunit